MASQLSPQTTERNDRSRISLPCISEDELMSQPPPSSRGSVSRTPSKQRPRVNSEPSVPNAGEVKNSSVISKTAGDDAAAGKIKMSSNHRKVSRRGSVPAGVSKEKDCNQGNTKTAKGSKHVKRRQVKLNEAPSPDVIDLSNEDVVHNLMMRLFETLKVPDGNTCNSSLSQQNDYALEEPDKQIITYTLHQTKPNRRKAENGITSHHMSRFPQLSKSTSNLEVFYSKPKSWKSLMTNRQLQPRIRSRNFIALQERSTKTDQINCSSLSWSFKQNSARTGRSTSVLRRRGLSEPLIVTNSSAFVSCEGFKTSFESRKSVTFAE